MSAPFPRLGPALLWLRKRRGLTQKELAESSEISAPYLCRIEAGQALPNLTTLGKLLDGLEADLAILALAYRAVEEPSPGKFKAPEGIPLEEQQALLLTAAGFQDFLTAAATRLTRP